jgi:hypothetical protein
VRGNETGNLPLVSDSFQFSGRLPKRFGAGLRRARPFSDFASPMELEMEYMDSSW